jgi:hypothetical protein
MDHILLFVGLAVVFLSCLQALSASTVFEVRQAGSDTNGGGFVTGSSGTDWSQQTGAQYATTDGVTAGTTTITSASANFGTDVVGNLIYVAGGTGSITAGWYQILTRVSSTTITVDRSTGLTTGTGATLNIGGALASWGQMSALMTISSMRAWIKYSATAYSLTSATANVSGGLVSLTGSATLNIEGYDQTRGDRTGNQPQLTWASVAAPGSNTYMFTMASGALQRVANVYLNGNSVNNVSGFSAAHAVNKVVQCSAENFSGTNGVAFLGQGSSAVGNFKSCYAYNSVTGFTATSLTSCIAVSCTTGFSNGEGFINCLASACGTGFSLTTGGGIADRCTADSCTVVGFTNASANISSYWNCLASNCTGSGVYGFNVGTNVASLEYCAVYNNATNINGTPFVNENLITLTQQPYVTAGSQFAPNNTSGGGASLRGQALGVFTQADNEDVGAVQHADPSGGTTYIFQVES